MLYLYMFYLELHIAENITSGCYVCLKLYIQTQGWWIRDAYRNTIRTGILGKFISGFIFYNCGIDIWGSGV